MVLGVREYPHDDPSYPVGFDAQVDEMRSWWCDRALGPDAFTPFTPAIATKRDLLDFIDQEQLSSAGSDDILMVYLTGHGLRPSSGRHYLRMPDGDDDQPSRTHVKTAELVELLLASDAEHVLVLVNSCFGNSITEDIRRAGKDLAKHRRDLDTVGVITIGDFDDRPRILELRQLLARARQRLRTVAGITTPHLTVDQFVSELTHAAREQPASELLKPTKVYPQHHTLTASLALPNPGYRTPDDLVEPQRRDVAAQSADLDYWLDRATGRTSSDDPGWYFSGRRPLTTQIADFLREATGSLIVTGVVGSGKSALLARAVTLTDPKFLADPRYAEAVAAITRTAAETIPPPGSVRAAVLARNQSPTSILRALAQAVHAELSPSVPGRDENGELRQAIAAATASRPVTFVIDGLDEATQPTHVVWEVLGPLAQLTDSKGVPLIRFAVGLRSSGPDTTQGTLLGLVTSVLPNVRVVRTDRAPEADIEAYVAAVLHHPDSPYWDHSDDLREAARVVARQVTPSFLDARFSTRALRARTSMQDLTDPGWLHTLAAGTMGLLAEDLRPLGEGAARHVLAVLRASAFAYGQGVPWAEVWPAMAEAVLDQTIPDPDAVIASVLDGRLAGYLTQAVEDERRVYRPVHEQLAHDLRNNKMVLP